jgi:hypothetical protein
MNEQKETTIIWPFGYRKEYSSRIAVAGIGVVNGPNKGDNINSLEIPYKNRSEDWFNPYIDGLRELALSYWLGSEYDIVLVQVEQLSSTPNPVTCIYHVFDALTHTALNLKYGFEWNDARSCHYSLDAVDYSILIPFLLTYYNGVFIDDTLMGESWVNYHRTIAENIPPKIKIHRKGFEDSRFLQVNSRKFVLEDS